MPEKSRGGDDVITSHVTEPEIRGNPEDTPQVIFCIPSLSVHEGVNLFSHNCVNLSLLEKKSRIEMKICSLIVWYLKCFTAIDFAKTKKKSLVSSEKIDSKMDEHMSEGASSS